MEPGLIQSRAEGLAVTAALTGLKVMAAARPAPIPVQEKERPRLKWKLRSPLCPDVALQYAGGHADQAWCKQGRLFLVSPGRQAPMRVLWSAATAVAFSSLLQDSLDAQFGTLYSFKAPVS